MNTITIKLPSGLHAQLNNVVNQRRRPVGYCRGCARGSVREQGSSEGIRAVKGKALTSSDMAVLLDTGPLVAFLPRCDRCLSRVGA